MKNQYFGDESDYRKYGILRALVDPGGLRVGVCWMLTPDDGRTDGAFTDYLDDAAEWRGYDPELFDVLDGLLAGVQAGRNDRSVTAADDLELVPGATYYSTCVPSGASERSEWYAGALKHLGDAELMFFDPDNGLEVKSRPYGSKGSEKHVFWSEVAQTYACGKSVLVFQYYPRRRRDDFHAELLAAARERAGADYVRILRTSRVAYLLVGQPSHVQQLDVATRALEAGWSGEVRVVHPRAKQRAS